MPLLTRQSGEWKSQWCPHLDFVWLGPRGKCRWWEAEAGLPSTGSLPQVLATGRVGRAEAGNAVEVSGVIDTSSYLLPHRVCICRKLGTEPSCCDVVPGCVNKSEAKCLLLQGVTWHDMRWHCKWGYLRLHFPKVQLTQCCSYVHLSFYSGDKDFLFSEYSLYFWFSEYSLWTHLYLNHPHKFGFLTPSWDLLFVNLLLTFFFKQSCSEKELMVLFIGSLLVCFCTRLLFLILV